MIVGVDSVIWLGNYDSFGNVNIYFLVLMVLKPKYYISPAGRKSCRTSSGVYAEKFNV